MTDKNSRKNFSCGIIFYTEENHDNKNFTRGDFNLRGLAVD